MAEAKTETKTAPQNLQKLSSGFRDLLRSENSEAARKNRRGMVVLYKKELTDHLESTRFQILFVLLAIVTALSVNGAISTLADSAQQASSGGTTLSEYVFLQLFTTSSSSIYSFSTFIGFLGPIIGIMLGFDAINEEVSQGTLNRLAAQPIYRDTIINAKFLAGATVIFLTVFSLGGWMVAVGLLRTGLTLTGEQAARIIIWFLVAVLYMCLWLAIAEFFSVVCKHAATAALACLSIWLVLTMFITVISNGIANAIYPVDGYMAQVNVLKYYSLNTAINRISPYDLFSEITTIILNPNVRSTDIVSILESQEGAIASYLTLGQSLLQIWPHIVSMIAETVAFFAAGYIAFMKREIRA